MAAGLGGGLVRALAPGAGASVLALGTAPRHGHARAQPGWPDDRADPSGPGGGGGDTGAQVAIDLPLLQYPGRWNPRPGAMRAWASELRLRTRIEPRRDPSTVRHDSTDMFRSPFLVIAGDAALPELGPTTEGHLRRFLDLGGMICFDAADGGTDAAFTASATALLQRIAPTTPLAPVARDHVLYRSFYLLDEPIGRTRASDVLLGVQDEGFLKAVVIRNDLLGALAVRDDGLYAYPCEPGGSEQREWATRFAINLLLYATCTDYKADRAHVETLLRSRRWR